jgi:hypothetical protein
MRFVRRVQPLIITTVLTLIATSPAGALTKEQALENCKNSVGREIVQACMRGGGDFASCRNKATPRVKSCVASALNAAHGRANVAVPLPKEQGPSADLAKRAAARPTNFVAPPRTINDIRRFSTASSRTRLSWASFAPMPTGRLPVGASNWRGPTITGRLHAPRLAG